MTIIAVPLPTLRRFPLYYRELKHALTEGLQHISSRELANSLDITADQVRKDLSYLDEKGKSGVGYEIRSLAAHLEVFLGLMNDKEAVLVGVGNLGRALAVYPGFASYGFQIVTLFDNDPAKIGQLVNGVEILPIEKLTDIVSRMHLRLGIIATPMSVAQDVADALVTGGIKVIWNFAPCRLSVPDNIFVKYEDLAVELAALSHIVEQLKITDIQEEI